MNPELLEIPEIENPNEAAQQMFDNCIGAVVIRQCIDDIALLRRMRITDKENSFDVYRRSFSAISDVVNSLSNYDILAPEYVSNFEYELGYPGLKHIDCKPRIIHGATLITQVTHSTLFYVHDDNGDEFAYTEYFTGDMLLFKQHDRGQNSGAVLHSFLVKPVEADITDYPRRYSVMSDFEYLSE